MMAMARSPSNPVVYEHRLADGSTVLTIDPEIAAFRRKLEQKLGRGPTLEETAAVWKKRRRMLNELGDEPA
jgi:hypothetical protein